MTQLALIDLPRMPNEWDEREAYYSRPEYVWPLVEYLSKCGLSLGQGTIVEPCVGGGALVDGLHSYLYGVDQAILTGDVRDVGADWVGDWTSRPKHWRWNRDVRRQLGEAWLCLSNPAFSIAKEVVEASWRHCPRAIVAMLLPSSFWGSQGRTPWLREHNPDIINIGRCDFLRPDGSSAGPGDSLDYFWCAWEAISKMGPRHGHHEIIPWREAPHA
jgi:hypothetical protein